MNRENGFIHSIYYQYINKTISVLVILDIPLKTPLKIKALMIFHQM